MGNYKCVVIQDGKQTLELKDQYPTELLDFEKAISFSISSQTLLTEFVLELDAISSWTMDAARKFVRSKGETRHPPHPVGNLLIVENRAGLIRVCLPNSDRLSVTQAKGKVRISTCVQDVSACGFGEFRSATPEETSLDVCFRIQFSKLSSLPNCIWLEPYPWGAKAAVCLTDHPDFDTLKNSSTLTDALVSNRVRITKGVFAAGKEEDGSFEAGLDCNGYRAQIDRLSNAGSEIAFHGFGPERDCPVLTECKRRMRVLAEYSPSTWIDHGTGEYLISRGNAIPGCEKGSLSSILGENGIRNYWSYHDVYHNPFSNLDSLSPNTWKNLVVDCFTGIQRVDGSLRSPKRFAYQFAHVAKNVLGNRVYSNLMSGGESLSTVLAAIVSNDSIRHRPLTLYHHQTGCSWALCSAEMPICFDTILLSHLAVQFEKSVLESLCANSGLLLAHVYLAAQLPHIGSNSLKSDSEVSEGFARGLGYLSDFQNRRELITLSFSELRRCWINSRRSRTVRTENGWMVQPCSQEAVFVGTAQVRGGLEHYLHQNYVTHRVSGATFIGDVDA